MSNQKKETKILILTLLITFASLGLGFILLHRTGGIQFRTGEEEPSQNPENLPEYSANKNANSMPIEYPETFAQVQNVPQGLLNR